MIHYRNDTFLIYSVLFLEWDLPAFRAWSMASVFYRYRFFIFRFYHVTHISSVSSGFIADKKFGTRKTK